METARVQQRWPTDLLRRVDEARGRATRTEFTLRALEAALDGPAQPSHGRLTRAEIDSRVIQRRPAPPEIAAPLQRSPMAPRFATMMARQQRLNDDKQRETDRRRRSGG